MKIPPPFKYSLFPLLLVFLFFSSQLTADTVSYSANPGNYQDVTNTLKDVFGTSDLNSGVFEETNMGMFEVGGTGSVEVPFTFLFDDGGYKFEFGYFIVTDTLLSMSNTTVEDKEAWAKEALSTAEVLLVDRDASSVPTGANRTATDKDDLYTSKKKDNYRDQDNYKSQNTVTTTLQSGTIISFFIIPNNTLQNFLSDGSDGNFDHFSVNQSGSKAWPLFTMSDANPGDNADGSGEGMDQTFSFTGTTRTTTGEALPSHHNPNFSPYPGKPGTVVTFEDIWRGPNSGSDNDFNDLHFFIGDVTAVVVPEASTWLSGLAGLFIIGLMSWKRRRN